MYLNWGFLMNDYIQNKKTILRELETMINNKQKGTATISVEMNFYCELMKRAYLSCSTNN